MTRLAVPLALPIMAAALAAASAAPPTATSDRIARLVSQLGDDDFRTRDAAAKELDAVGRPALVALRTAAETGDDAEVSRRAADLAARIARRVGNDAALSPVLVELDVRNGTLADALDALEKQSGYKLRVPVPGDAPGLTVRTDGKVPYWAAVQKVCEAAGLDVAPALAPFRTGTAQTSPFNNGLANPAAAVAAANERQLAVVRDFARMLADQAATLDNAVAELEAKKVKAVGDEAKVLDALIGKQKAQAVAIRAKQAVVEAQAAALAQKPADTQPVPPGTIVLRVAPPVRPPVFVSGAARVEAGPPLPAHAAATPSDQLAVVLQVVPEPRLGLERVADVRVTKAVADDGRTLTALIADPVPPPSNERVLANGRVVIVNGNIINANPVSPAAAAKGLTAFQAEARFRRPDGSAPATLKRLEGVLTAQVRSGVEEIAVVEKLNSEKVASAVGENGTKLQSGLIANPDADTFKLLVTLSFDPSQVQPPPSGQSTRGLVPENRASGFRTSNGLALTDADGKPYDLSVSRTTTRIIQPANGPREYVRDMTVTASPTFDGQGPPVRLAFSGTRAKTIDVPFVLEDVALSAGTGPVGEK